MHNQSTRWILVAGTGKYELSEAEFRISKEIGRAIAARGYGLVAGGWKGVDYVVTEAFAEELKKQEKPLSNYLIQIVPQGKSPEFRGGHVIYVEPGDKEWTESVRYAEVVVLIGGLGGTYETYLFAAQEQKPVLPVAATEGDARKVFNDILQHWSLQEKGISQTEFQSILNRPVTSEEDASRLSMDMMDITARYFQLEEEALETKRERIFISYSHKDKRWLEKLRTMLKPLERQLNLYIWDDTAIEAGDKWKQQIDNALDATKIAVFLVSPGFTASEFIDNNELPPLLEAAQKAKVVIFWILLSSCLHETTGLDAYQAAHDISRPLDLLTPARQNETLVKIARKIREAAEKK